MHPEGTNNGKESLCSSAEKHTSKAEGQEHCWSAQQNEMQKMNPTQDELGLLSQPLTIAEKREHEVLITDNHGVHQSPPTKADHHHHHHHSASSTQEKRPQHSDSTKPNEQGDHLAAWPDKGSQDAVWRLQQEGDFEAFTSSPCHQ